MLKHFFSSLNGIWRAGRQTETDILPSYPLIQSSNAEILIAARAGTDPITQSEFSHTQGRDTRPLVVIFCLPGCA